MGHRKTGTSSPSAGTLCVACVYIYTYVFRVVRFGDGVSGIGKYMPGSPEIPWATFYVCARVLHQRVRMGLGFIEVTTGQFTTMLFY